jgi:hypothetical protein
VTIVGCCYGRDRRVTRDDCGPFLDFAGNKKNVTAPMASIEDVAVGAGRLLAAGGESAVGRSPGPGARDGRVCAPGFCFVPGFCCYSTGNPEQSKRTAACRRQARPSGRAHYTRRTGNSGSQAARIRPGNTPGTVNLKTDASKSVANGPSTTLPADGARCAKMGQTGGAVRHDGNG